MTHDTYRRAWRPSRRVLPCLFLAALTYPGCMPERSQRDRATTTGDQPGAAAKAPALDLVLESTWPAAYAGDPLWLRASAGDDIDHARLGRRESALDLVNALRHGGSLGRTALLALRYAPDRREVRTQLCALMPGATAATSSLLLDALYEAVSEGPVTEASIDAPGDANCARILRALTLDGALHAADRDRVTGTIARLGEP